MDAYRIPLLDTHNETTAAWAVIDADDLPKAAPYMWRLEIAGDGYQATAGSPPTLLHDLIGAVPAPYSVGHRDGNGLDCRKANLYVISPAHQPPDASNTSGCRGISWDAARGKYRVRLSAGGKRRQIGYYTTYHDASHAYETAAAAIFGQGAGPLVSRYDHDDDTQPTFRDVVRTLPEGEGAWSTRRFRIF